MLWISHPYILCFSKTLYNWSCIKLWRCYLLLLEQFIYDLPTRLQKCIKSEAYAEAVKFYTGATPIFKVFFLALTNGLFWNYLILLTFAFFCILNNTKLRISSTIALPLTSSLHQAYGDSSFLDCKRSSEEAVSVIMKNLQAWPLFFYSIIFTVYEFLTCKYIRVWIVCTSESKYLCLILCDSPTQQSRCHLLPVE